MALGVLVDGDGVLERLAEQTARQNADMDVGSVKPLTSKPAAANNCFARLTAGCSWASVRSAAPLLVSGVPSRSSGGDDLEGNRKR